MKIKVRKVAEDDWKAIKKIYNEWRAEGAYAVPEHLLSDKDAKRNAKFLAEHGINLVAEVNNKVVGLLESTQGRLPKTAHTVDIGQLNVSIEYRRFGIGKKLVQSLLDISRKKKINVLFLYVAANNRPAIRFYEKLGFKTTGYIKNQLRFGNKYVNNNIMCKTL